MNKPYWDIRPYPGHNLADECRYVCVGLNIPPTYTVCATEPGKETDYTRIKKQILQELIHELFPTEDWYEENQD